MIYLVRAGDTVKIGYSETEAGVHRRLAGFQTGNPLELQLLAVAPGDRRREAELHRRFSHLRAHGEWFRAAPELLAIVGSPEFLGEPLPSVPAQGEISVPLTFVSLNPSGPPPLRLSSSLRGVDAVLGGGFVQGSTTLLSGDPGAGKSTLLLQIAAYVGCRGYPAVYATAEEAAGQVQRRSARLGLALAPVDLVETFDAAAVIASLRARLVPPRLLIVDSLQTFIVPTAHATRGTPTQTRAVLAELIRYAHDSDAAVVVVSHVNKSSRASGTNDLQHDVDVLLHLHAIADRRVLRARKNRFGPIDVEAQFRMTAEGIRE